jgi:hypothetical protein
MRLTIEHIMMIIILNNGWNNGIAIGITSWEDKNMRRTISEYFFSLLKPT